MHIVSLLLIGAWKFTKVDLLSQFPEATVKLVHCWSLDSSASLESCTMLLCKTITILHNDQCIHLLCPTYKWTSALHLFEILPPYLPPQLGRKNHLIGIPHDSENNFKIIVLSSFCKWGKYFGKVEEYAQVHYACLLLHLYLMYLCSSHQRLGHPGLQREKHNLCS